MKIVLSGLLLCLGVSLAWSDGPEGRYLHKEVVVPVTVAQAWKDWTEPERLQYFFGPQVTVELRTGGLLEILFFPDAPKGSRGAEGLQVLAVTEGQSYSFTWNAPPNWPNLRQDKLTRVTISFQAVDDTHTRVTLVHDRFQEGMYKGEAWDEIYDYFNSAWNIILGRYVASVHDGPIDFSKRNEKVAEYSSQVTTVHP